MFNRYLQLFLCSAYIGVCVMTSFSDVSLGSTGVILAITSSCYAIAKCFYFEYASTSVDYRMFQISVGRMLTHWLIVVENSILLKVTILIPLSGAVLAVVLLSSLDTLELLYLVRYRQLVYSLRAT